MKRLFSGALSLLVLTLVAALLTRMPAQSKEDNGSDESKIKQGLDISPVKLNLAGRNRALVGLGSYLVNAAGGCNDCHTCPSYLGSNNPFHGQPGAVNADAFLAGGVPFGPFTSRNRTPDPDDGNLPAGLSFEDFKLVMRTGIDLDHKHPQISPLLQVMPWPVYRNQTDRDLRAIHEYLSAIPHADTPPPGTCSTAGE